jgi:poly(beta-D-mannuronate) lyase
LPFEDRCALKRSPSIRCPLIIASLAFLGLAGGKPAPVMASPPASALSADERQALDLDHYVVTDPSAGYFDVAARLAFFRHTPNALLRSAADRLAAEVRCEVMLAVPVVDYELRLPSFYEEPETWRAAIEPLFAFEDAVSDLAGAFVATGADHFAWCLLDLLNTWAQADALARFHYEEDDLQAWFNIEDMLFAAGLAYSVVRDQAIGRAADKRRIDAWLSRVAKKHLSFEGGPSSCCNNHLYRRALYASIIGVLNDDDELFQVGVGALMSALHEMTERGALPREVARGPLATHYQNYGLLYLVPIAEIIERQGYPAFAMEIGGRTIHDAVGFAIDILEHPNRLGALVAAEQDVSFMQDDQYFAWMEIYLSRFDNPRLERWIAARRPLYNRSAGGHVTLFFWDAATDRNRS